ncbi:hypothetical protein DYQ86_26950 [Acidobacteria bacterium AB60]|nr:hypothetical protein DYQ86_26950 [Acidobacteria bacterium AB60]
MTDRSSPPPDPYRFIEAHIDSVPHLEALILLWNSRPVGWTTEELVSRLYVPPEQVDSIVRDLARAELLRETASSPYKYAYHSRTPDQDEMMHHVDAAYRQDLVRISSAIHRKASSAVREFARAFRLRKEQDK